MTFTAPLLLQPVLVDKPWGGDRLRAFGRDVDAGARVGESWEVADLPVDATAIVDPVSRVVDGPHAGQTLGELILALDHAGMLGAVATGPDGRFPMLVKLLDARETLSVQVHPPRSLDPASAKTESWVVLHAEPGAELYLGVLDDVTLEDVLRALGTAALLPLLRRVPATAGDVVHVAAGTIHALGAGVLVAEVQTPTDVTHRVWDWPDTRAGGRDLHVAEARAAITAGWDANLDVAVTPARDGVLVDTDAYRLERVTLADGGMLADGRTDAPRVVVVLDGQLRWSPPDGLKDVTLARGGVTLLPAANSTPITASGTAQLLVATPT